MTNALVLVQEFKPTVWHRLTYDWASYPGWRVKVLTMDVDGINEMNKLCFFGVRINGEIQRRPYPKLAKAWLVKVTREYYDDELLLRDMQERIKNGTATVVPGF